MTPLEKVRDLLKDPTKWTKGAFARDLAGRACPPCDERAVCWCVIGAVQKLGPMTSKALAWTAPLGKTITDYNDSIEHPELLAWLDRAIELEHGPQP